MLVWKIQCKSFLFLQVHVKPKQDTKKSPRDKRVSHSSSHHSRDSSIDTHQFHRPKHDKSKAHSNSRAEKCSKLEQTAEINFSKDKLAHMKKLAHELSLKFASKVSASSKENTVVDEEKDTQQERNTLNDPNSAEKIHDIGKGGVCNSDEAQAELEGDSNNKDAAVSTNLNEVEREREFEENPMDSVLPEIGPLQETIMANDSDDDLEDMKQIAQELSKELLKKVKTAAALNLPKISEIGGVVKHFSKSDGNPSIKDSVGVESDIISIEESPVPEIDSQSAKETISSNSSASLSESKLRGNVVHHNHNNYNSKLNEYNESSTSSKHKKSKKHKKNKNRHKDAVFEGERVRGLVKASTLEEKTKEEIQEQASHNAKQDDYVLRKLFAKTGKMGPNITCSPS